MNTQTTPMSFKKKSATELLKRFNINEYAINLKHNKQQLYELIYSLALVKLEILKTYIKINLVNNLISSSKFVTRASILYIQKLDSNFYQDINY